MLDRPATNGPVFLRASLSARLNNQSNISFIKEPFLAFIAFSPLPMLKFPYGAA